MKRGILIGLVVVLAIAGGWFGFVKYNDYKFVDAVTPRVKNTTLRLNNVIRYETDSAAKITYKEIFAKLESEIAEVDKHILEVDTLSSPSNKALADPLLGYLKGSQELLRALLQKYRKTMAFSSALDSLRRAGEDLRDASNSYAREYAYKRSEKARAEGEEAAVEAKKSASDVVSTVTRMRDHRSAASKVVADEILIAVATLDALEKSSAEEAK
jgi:hypothetical protein